MCLHKPPPAPPRESAFCSITTASSRTALCMVRRPNTSPTVFYYTAKVEGCVEEGWVSTQLRWPVLVALEGRGRGTGNAARQGIRCNHLRRGSPDASRGETHDVVIKPRAEHCPRDMHACTHPATHHSAPSSCHDHRPAPHPSTRPTARAFPETPTTQLILPASVTALAPPLARAVTLGIAQPCRSATNHPFFANLGA